MRQKKFQITLQVQQAIATIKERHGIVSDSEAIRLAIMHCALGDLDKAVKAEVDLQQEKTK